MADLTLDLGPMLVLRMTRSGYADQTRMIQLPTTSGAGTRFSVVMRARDAAQTLTDVHVGGSLVGRAGATITLPADALVNPGGAVVTGPVSISMTTVARNQPKLRSGRVDRPPVHPPDKKPRRSRDLRPDRRRRAL